MSKVVVLFSGGMDSTTILTEAVVKHGAENVIALSLIYGQKHVKELESAKAVAEYFNVLHITKDISDIFEFASNPLLGHGDLPRGEYIQQLAESDGVVSTYVPFRNGLFISLATAIAYSLGASTVLYGAHADDAAGNAYPDCTPVFYGHMGAAIVVGTSERVQLEAPLQYMTKADIALHGINMGAPFHLTWSCYEGSDVSCGTCGTCVDRRNAFLVHGFVDPLTYADESDRTDGAGRQETTN